MKQKITLEDKLKELGVDLESFNILVSNEMIKEDYAEKFFNAGIEAHLKTVIDSMMEEVKSWSYTVQDFTGWKRVDRKYDINSPGFLSDRFVRKHFMRPAIEFLNSAPGVVKLLREKGEEDFLDKWIEGGRSLRPSGKRGFYRNSADILSALADHNMLGHIDKITEYAQIHEKAAPSGFNHGATNDYFEYCPGVIRYLLEKDKFEYFERWVKLGAELKGTHQPPDGWSFGGDKVVGKYGNHGRIFTEGNIPGREPRYFHEYSLSAFRMFIENGMTDLLDKIFESRDGEKFHQSYLAFSKGVDVEKFLNGFSWIREQIYPSSYDSTLEEVALIINSDLNYRAKKEGLRLYSYLKGKNVDERVLLAASYFTLSDEDDVVTSFLCSPRTDEYLKKEALSSIEGCRMNFLGFNGALKAIEGSGITATPYLFEELARSPDKEGTIKSWKEDMTSFEEGHFDPNSELHRNLEYTNFKKKVDNEKLKKYIKNHFTFEDYISIFDRSPEGREFSGGDIFEIECAAYESNLLLQDLLRLNKHARAMGREMIVVPNFSYGYLPVAPITEKLKEAGIDVLLGSKVPSTACHTSKEVFDSRFLKGRRTKIMDSQPLVVVVDGSNHILDREGGKNKKARNPDAYIGVSNQVIAINDALGFNENNTPELRENYESFGKTYGDLDTLRWTQEFQRLVSVLGEVDPRPVKRITGKRIVFDLDNTLIGSKGQVRPHAVELLDQLVRDQNDVCVWTYGKRDETEAKLKAAGLEKYFSTVVTQEDYRDPELRQDTLKDIRTINGDILIDNRNNNVENAQEAGIKAIKVSGYKRGKSKGLKGLYRAISKALEPEQEERRPYLFGSRNDLDKDLIIRFEHEKIGEMPNLEVEDLNQPYVLLRVAGVTHDLLPDEIKAQCPDDVDKLNDRYKHEFYSKYGPCHVPAYWDDSSKIIDFNFGFDSFGVRYLNRLETEVKKACARQKGAPEPRPETFKPELVKYIEINGSIPTVCESK